MDQKALKCLNPFYTLEIVLGETWHHLSTIYAFVDDIKIKSKEVKSKIDLVP